jgi:flagellar biosynthesis/type III secretory pathway M-ring protein FliF/YscJ
VERLKQLYALLKDLFLSMTLGNRIVASLLVAMLLISLGYLIVGGIKRPDPNANVACLYNGYRFSPNELRAADASLSKAGFSDYRWRGDKLEVPVKKVAAYTAKLAEDKVIEESGLTRIKTAMALSPWESTKMMDTKMLSSKEQDAIEAIKMLGGGSSIANASVISNKRPEWNTNVWARTQIYSAVAIVESVENKPLSDNTIIAISGIVAPAFGITNFKEIRIVDSKHNRTYNGAGEEESGGQGAYLRHQTRYQEDFNNRIYQLLPPIPGLKVETTVDLTTEFDVQYLNIEHRKPTVLTNHVMGYDFRKEGYDRFARPGQIAQFSRPLIDPAANVSQKDLTTEKKHENEVTNALPGTETKGKQAPFVPRRVLASIQIPRGHIRKVWLEKNRRPNEPTAEPTAEQLSEEQNLITQDTKRSVAKMLELYRNPKADPLEVVEVIFYDPYTETVHELTNWEKTVIFLKQNWQSLSLMGLVLGGLVVLWSITKAPKPEPIVIYEAPEIPLEVFEARARAKAEADAAAAEAAAISEEEQAEINRVLDPFGSMHSLKDEIAELIAENPEAAAAVLRQWIGNTVLVESKN